MFNKKNLPLIIALALPVLMIIIIAAAIYFPGINKKPQANFLYVTGDNVMYGSFPGEYYYLVQDGKVVKKSYPPQDQNLLYPKVYPQAGSTQQLFIYDVSKNESSEIAYDQSQNLNLDPANTSKDGFTVGRGNNSGDPFFGGSRDYNSWYIIGHNRSFKLNLKLIGNSYDNFKFLGWIK